MGLADARAIYPALDVVEEESEADRKLLFALADWCDRYTPLIAIDGLGCLLLDITGCIHLFGGERRMQDDLVHRLASQGFEVRTGLAGTPAAAWAAARFGVGPIEAGEEAEKLAPLPLSALRLDPATLRRLESVGLRTVGAILCLPRAPLVRRFGKELMLRLDQMLGVVEKPISPLLPVAPLSAERHLAEPIGLVDDIEHLLLLLASSLQGDMERRGEGARRLELSLFRVDGVVSRIAVGTSRPLRAPGQIARLFHERLAALSNHIDAGCGFDLVRLAVLVAARLEETQSALMDEESDAGEKLALFADRVRARLGERAMLRPVMVESHIPERAVSLLPFAEVSEPSPLAPTFRDDLRPIRLFRQPEPIEVTAEVPDGPPAAFRWRRMHHRITAAEGPERIAPEWWEHAMPQIPAKDEHGKDRTEKEMDKLRRDALASRTASLTRDYFRIEDTHGLRYWLYREGFYGEKHPPKWFMHGLLA